MLTIHPGEKNKRNGLLYGSNFKNAGNLSRTLAMEGRCEYRFLNHGTLIEFASRLFPHP